MSDNQATGIATQCNAPHKQDRKPTVYSMHAQSHRKQVQHTIRAPWIPINLFGHTVYILQYCDICSQAWQSTELQRDTSTSRQLGCCSLHGSCLHFGFWCVQPSAAAERAQETGSAQYNHWLVLNTVRHFSLPPSYCPSCEPSARLLQSLLSNHMQFGWE